MPRHGSHYGKIRKYKMRSIYISQALIITFQNKEYWQIPEHMSSYMGCTANLSGHPSRQPSIDNARWSTAAAQYEKIIAPVTAKAGAVMVQAVVRAKHINNSSRILDVGAGTGCIERTLRQLYKEYDCPISAFDIAPGMVKQIRSQNFSNVFASIGDATALDKDLAPDSHFTHAFGSHMIQFCGKRQLNVCRELFRCLEPGGIAALSIGHGTNGPEPWHRACQQLDATYVPYEEYDTTAWQTVQQVSDGMKEAGFVDMDCLDVWMHLDCNHDEWVHFWFEGGHPIYLKHMQAWAGELSEVRPVFERILKEEYPDPSMLGTFSGIVIGRKPAK